MAEIPFIIVIREEQDKARIQSLFKEEDIALLSDLNLTTKLPGGFLFFYRSNRLGISSTLIRAKIKNKQGIDDFVDEGVKNIMEEYNLYG